MSTPVWGELVFDQTKNTRPGQVIEVGSLTHPASYVISKAFVYGVARYYALNGTTGKVDFEGPSAQTVIQAAVNALTGIGGNVFVRAADYGSPSVTLVSGVAMILEGGVLNLNPTVVTGSALRNDLIPPTGTTGYGTIQNQGGALPVQTILDFVGAAVTATNDATNSRTIATITVICDVFTEATKPSAVGSAGRIIRVTDGAAGRLIQVSDGTTWIGIPGTAPSGYTTIQNQGTALPAQTTIDFVGAAVVASNDAANSRSLATITNTADAFTEATKPSAASNAGRMIRVTDAAVGAIIQVSDGSTWKGIA